MSSVRIYNTDISKNKEIHGIRRCIKALGLLYIWEGMDRKLITGRTSATNKDISMLRNANIYIDRKQVSNDGDEQPNL